MSDVENDKPSTNANGKRINALELGPRKKAYVLLSHTPLYRFDRPLLGQNQTHWYIMGAIFAAPYMPCAISMHC